MWSFSFLLHVEKSCFVLFFVFWVGLGIMSYVIEPSLIPCIVSRTRLSVARWASFRLLGSIPLLMALHPLCIVSRFRLSTARRPSSRLPASIFLLMTLHKHRISHGAPALKLIDQLAIPIHALLEAPDRGGSLISFWSSSASYTNRFWQRPSAHREGRD